MADLTTRIGPLELGTPFVLASGPLSHDGNALLRAHRAGAGAVVTKTISREAARNPVPHIAKIGSGLLNSEKWSDLPAQAWIEEEIPRAKSGGATVIASVGLNVEEVEAIGAELAEAGADALEVCSYDASQIVPMVRAAARRVSIPILAKLSANWPDVANVARQYLGDLLKCCEQVTRFVGQRKLLDFRLDLALLERRLPHDSPGRRVADA